MLLTNHNLPQHSIHFHNILLVILGMSLLRDCLTHLQSKDNLINLVLKYINIPSQALLKLQDHLSWVHQYRRWTQVKRIRCSRTLDKSIL